MVTGQGGREGEKLFPAPQDIIMSFCQARHDILPANANLLHLLCVFVLASDSIIMYSRRSMSASHLVLLSSYPLVLLSPFYSESMPQVRSPDH